MATKITLHNPDTGLTATASYELSSITPVTAAFQIVWAFFCNRCYSRGLISKGLKITVAALAVTLPAISAQAQAPRTFVSEAGNDSNPCSFAAPCRHFQAAVNATSAGGEVDALDPAGYGPITITQGITIEGQGWSYIAPPASGNAITINAGGSDKIYIHGVSLNGAGITGGTNGIVFNSGNGLTVTDCVVQNFQYAGPGQTTGDGILVQPSSGAISFVITQHGRFKQRLCWHYLSAAKWFDGHRKRCHRPCRNEQQSIWDCDQYSAVWRWVYDSRHYKQHRQRKHRHWNFRFKCICCACGLDRQHQQQ